MAIDHMRPAVALDRSGISLLRWKYTFEIAIEVNTTITAMTTKPHFKIPVKCFTGLCFWCKPHRLSFQIYAQPHQMNLDFSAVMSGIHATRRHIRNLLHLLEKRLPAARAGRQAGKDLKRFEYP